MTLSALLTHWRAEPDIYGNVADWRSLVPRPARFVPFPPDLHPTLVASLEQRGLRALYTHQGAAWQLSQAGNSLVIVTGTASGKTLAYNLPVLDRLLRHPQARALYLFPTKALAQDQLQSAQSLLAGALDRVDAEEAADSGSSYPIPLAIYDGDTPAHARAVIRANARLVMSNPDMLHSGILPHHTRWADFFHNLHFVVIDEMHVYRGVFGSHVANLIRRLKRVASFYGATPQFILTSATIANPAEHAEKLVEDQVALIDDDGAAQGPRHFLIYNPPIVDKDLGLRRSALLESVRLTEDLLHYNVQTIIFARSRRSVELVLTYLRQRIQESPGSSFAGSSSTEERIRGYRSGYLPRQRREIERGLRQGEVRGVVATNALELGIDIGGMGAALLAGYPGSIAGTWQQAGRAGRGSETSLALLVATANPLDQFLAHHPDYFFGRSPEHALINPDNLLILLAHLRCAAFELPFRNGEPFGRLPATQVAEFLLFLAEEGTIHRSGEKFFWMADHYPAENISLRSASTARLLLQIPGQDGWVTIGEVDQESASWLVHPQAVYIHEAQTYLVEDLDLEQRLVHLRPTEIDYYTEPKTQTTVELLELLENARQTGYTKAYGDIQVTSQVTGFRKVKYFTHEQLGLGELSLPPSELQTTGFWIAPSEQVVERLRQEGLWTNDPNNYGPNWEALRALVRARDGYRCQVCGAPEQARAHDVHHKIPFRSFAAPEQANQLHNLITLCPNCHRKVEASLRMRSGLAGLAYALGNLAPFFLMCDPRDLGVHSDPQSPLAEGGPAVVLYDQVPAGIGFSQRLYELHAELLERAHELISRCECVDGCPSCVGPAGENGMGGKTESLALLAGLISS